MRMPVQRETATIGHLKKSTRFVSEKIYLNKEHFQNNNINFINAGRQEIREYILIFFLTLWCIFYSQIAVCH